MRGFMKTFFALTNGGEVPGVWESFYSNKKVGGNSFGCPPTFSYFAVSYFYSFPPPLREELLLPLLEREGV